MDKDIDTIIRQDVVEMRKKLDARKQKYFFKEKLSMEEFLNNLKTSLSEKLKEDWEEYFKYICEELNNEIKEKKEIEKFTSVMRSIKDKTDNIESYIDDLLADTYLASLRIYKKCDVKFDNSMKQEWSIEKACNKAINMENAKSHYPLICYVNEDFTKCGIPGGCKEYHKLMIQQKNLGLFDINSSKESLEQYAFPKTHDIYKELKYSPIENLLLLEKTQGIGYTNQLYCYLKDIAEKEQLEKLEEIIECVAEIPMIIRKDITDEIWSYLYYCKYSDASVQCVKDAVYGIVYLVKETYKKIWKFNWQIFIEGKCPFYALEGTLTTIWRDYFSEFEVYEDFLNSKDLCGLRDVEDIRGKEEQEEVKKGKKVIDGVMSCFIACGDNKKTLLAKDKRGNEIINTLVMKKSEAQYFGENMNDGKTGEMILQEVYEELKEQENKKWKVDPKRKTVNLGPMDVYARVHEYVVRTLNK